MVGICNKLKMELTEKNKKLAALEEENKVVVELKVQNTKLEVHNSKLKATKDKLLAIQANLERDKTQLEEELPNSASVGVASALGALKSQLPDFNPETLNRGFNCSTMTEAGALDDQMKPIADAFVLKIGLWVVSSSSDDDKQCIY